ncbi:MAG: class 1b ribonucleoside-diphosphate reductase subunit beta [Chitinophagaceae bacterium]
MSQKLFKAVNWNKPSNDYVEVFWQQNLRQFWVDTEYTPSKDIDVWQNLGFEMQLAYMQALGGLTLLDTLQSHVGMPKCLDHVKDLQNKSVMSFMCMMESIHAKSYSTIFTTVCSQEQIDYTFKWVENNKHLQFKAATIEQYYRATDNPDISDREMYLALAASVLLESFLFYSGFFLPLWLAGQGKMVASADIIKKIVADESIHGVFVGLLAQEIYNAMPPLEKEVVRKELYDLMDVLFENEMKYTDEVYTDIGLTADVKEYVKYNGNKALANLGFGERYEVKEVNQIVLNGLTTSVKTTQHDFFSKKSTNYEMATEVEHLKDEDFKVDLSVPV